MTCPYCEHSMFRFYRLGDTVQTECVACGNGHAIMAEQAESGIIILKIQEA